MRSLKQVLLVVMLLLVIFLFGTAPAPLPVAAQEIPDYWPTDGWRTSSPEEQGMDSEALTAAVDYLLKQEQATIHSLLVIRNGYIVLDASFYPYTPGSLHDFASVAKSITSTLVGIAINEGHLENVQQPVLDFFPEREIANIDAQKEAMTLEDLLTMRSGFECINDPTEETLIRMFESPDWVQFTLDLPMATEPGTTWEYCSPVSHLLAAVVQQATGINTLEYAETHLFTPLGISDVIWPVDPQGIIRGFGDLRMTPQDMAKIGYLFLNNGMWQDEQLLPSSWVAAATNPQPDLDFYGYQWWLSTDTPLYSASGRGGQGLFVFPEADLIVVVTGNGLGVDRDTLGALLLPAIGAETPLPANPAGVAALEASVRQATAPPTLDPEPVPPLPDIAQTVSGQTYLMSDNAYGFSTISLDFPANDEALLSITTTPESPFDNGTFEWLVGLDSVARIHPGRYGINMAAAGQWLDDSTFEIRVDEIGNNFNWRVRLTFEKDQVTLVLIDQNASLSPLTFSGSLEGAGQETISTDVFVFIQMDILLLTSGPGHDYPVTGILEQGDFIGVIGRNAAGDWLQLDSGAWIPTEIVAVTGDSSVLPVVEVTLSAEEAFATRWEADNQRAFDNPPVIDETTLQQYVGTYDVFDTDFSEPLFSMSLFIENGVLMVELPDQVVPLRPASDTLFIIDPDTHLEFLFPHKKPIIVRFLLSDGAQRFVERVDE